MIPADQADYILLYGGIEKWHESLLSLRSPGKPAERIEVENDLMTFQHLVDDYIEWVPIATGVLMIVGTAVFVGVDDDEFADCP